MGRRKGRKDSSETLIRNQGENDENEREIADDEEGGGNAKFFACYLLTSLCPRFKGHTYIGFTVNPRRRIRQHNGEIGSGAWRTKKRRPWEMVLCIYGFPTNVAALQFEWAWQHPIESLAVRNAAVTFKSLSGLANKIKLAYTMVTLPAWQSLNLTVNFFSTKYQKHIAGCPSLPGHMRVQVCSMDELPCYSGTNWSMGEDDGWHGDDCEHSAGSSHECTEDGLTEAQKIGDAAGPLNSCEGTEGDKHKRNWMEENETRHEQGLWGEETGLERLNNSLIREEDNWQSLKLDDYPLRASSLCLSGNVTNDAEDTGIPILLNDCGSQYDQLPEQLSPTTTVVANKEQTRSISSAVEVIDLFTPSPCCKASTGNKKRRICPEIIDLTNSPMSV